MKAPLRQGDILLVPVEAVPEGLKAVSYTHLTLPTKA